MGFEEFVCEAQNNDPIEHRNVFMPTILESLPICSEQLKARLVHDTHDNHMLISPGLVSQDVKYKSQIVHFQQMSQGNPECEENNFVSHTWQFLSKVLL